MSQYPTQGFEQQPGGYPQNTPPAGGGYAAQPGGYPQQPGGYPQNTPPAGGGYPAQQQPQQQPAKLPSLADEIASAGGVPTAFRRETPLGTIFEGPVLEAGMIQSTDFKSGRLEFWDDMNPKMKVRIVIQTNHANPNDPRDDGRRAIYVNWWGENRKNLLAAIEAAGDTDIRPGGYFGAQFATEKPNPEPGMSPTKIFQYQYQKPGAGIGAMAPAQQPPQQAPAAQPAQQQPPQAAPAQQAPPATDPWTGAPTAQPAPAEQAPQQAPAAQPAPAEQAPAAPAHQADSPDAQIRKFIGLGMTDDQIAGAAGVTPAQVAAVRAVS